ncbi:MAG: helix-turn-helix domain-containing protein [Egibacteraceae bacterium]
MSHDQPTPVQRRAAAHRALGDPTRLAVVDALWASDRTPQQLCELTGLASNLLAFHLEVLEQAGLVSRHRSQGDRRRRYVMLAPVALPYVDDAAPLGAAPRHVACVLFVCTHNAARSQMAAALWRRRTSGDALSAGTRPADRIHPHAVAVAAAHGLHLGDARPRHLDELDIVPDLTVSVCDRANESDLSFGVEHRHWSIRDPMGHDRAIFEDTYARIADRVERLAAETAA